MIDKRLVAYLSMGIALEADIPCTAAETTQTLFADTYRSYGLETVRYPVLEVTARIEPYENGNGYSLRVLRAETPRST